MAGVPHFFLVAFVMANFGIIRQGASQIFVNLERSGPSLPCMDDVVEYTCTTNSLQVQWIVQPFIEDNTVTFLNVASNNGNILIREPNITFRQVSALPLVTVMRISGCLNSTDVAIICLGTTDNVVNQSSFISGCVVRDLVVSLKQGEGRGDFHDSTIAYCINNESLSSNMDYYNISCLDDTCPTQIVTENVGEFTIPYSVWDCSMSNVVHTVNIYGVNGCGVRSNTATVVVNTKVDKEFCEVLRVLLAIIFLILFIAAIIPIILISWKCFFKKYCKECYKNYCEECCKVYCKGCYKVYCEECCKVYCKGCCKGVPQQEQQEKLHNERQQTAKAI